MNHFFAKIKKHKEQNLPFVVYCKPNSDTVFGMFQQNSNLYEVIDYKEKGFVFASFDGNQTLLIPENHCEISSFIWKKETVTIFENELDIPNDTDKKSFERVVTKGIKAIKNNEFKKVVLSRKERVNLSDFDLGKAFNDLVQSYPSTFVYCFFHPKVGTWLGATPEQLLKANRNSFQTVSLAGTQKDSGSKEILWEKKEQQEQQYVTDYIVETLHTVATEVLVSKPYSLKAGSIWHIKTDISGVLNSETSLRQVIQLLHPTPAVCGLPKENAKEFILENENYDRSFYSGFLGELNSSLSADSKSSDLFVNLRCMEIEFASELAITKAYLYMGCGITKDSIPEKEWEESRNKSMTMKKVLDYR